MEIKVYTQQSCPQCKMVKMMLDRKHVDYTACEDVEEMRAKGILHTPTLEIDGQTYVAKAMIDKIREL